MVSGAPKARSRIHPLFCFYVTDIHHRGRLTFPMSRERHCWVYILQSVSRRVLYIGVTSNINLRIWQHKHHAIEGFTDDNNCVRLVWMEAFERIENAIAREKQLKRWTRAKKVWLITLNNPRWEDLAEDWGKPIIPLLDQK